MAYRLIHLRLEEVGDVLDQLRDMDEIEDVWRVEDDDPSTTYALLVQTQDVQGLTDRLQSLYSKEHLKSIVVLPVEAVLPQRAQEKDEAEKEDKKSKNKSSISREELYNDVASTAHLSAEFSVLVILSTVVAAIGLLEDNVAVIIGAMVIAPLLGPNLALALATALGDTDLMLRAAKTNAAGLFLTLILSVLLGLVWPFGLNSVELLTRTTVGFDGVTLAIASGAAAALSLTSGLAMTLVGVMVAVALMPPAVTLGMMSGAGLWPQAMGAALLLATNVICVNLAANIVFWFRGVQPRTWGKRKAARRAMVGFTIAWVLALLLVLGFIAQPFIL